MAIAILMALYHRHRTGVGQWIDMSCTDGAAALNGPAILDYTVNGNPGETTGQSQQQPQHLSQDGAARDIPMRGRRQLGRHLGAK